MAQVLVNDDARLVSCGKEYHAVTATKWCYGCEFFTPGVMSIERCVTIPCTPHKRADKAHVIWVEAR